jgi:hypothetical protein
VVRSSGIAPGEEPPERVIVLLILEEHLLLVLPDVRWPEHPEDSPDPTRGFPVVVRVDD